MREAALWLAKLDSGTADMAAFEAWRDADPRHAAAIVRLAGVSDQLDRARPHLESEDIDSLVRAPTSRRRFVWGAFAASVAAAIGFAGISMWSSSRASAVTGVGGRQIIAFPKGGELDLNTDTKVTYKFGSDHHQVWLERGEVAITIPPGELQCRLMAGDGVVLLNNGKLDARLSNHHLAVTMQDGTGVLVHPAAQPTVLTTNEVAVLTPKKLDAHLSPDAERQFATGWQTDELILNGQTLAEAVAEFNRYQETKIEIADPSLSNLRLGGRFSLRDPNDFLASLKSSFGIGATKTPSGAIALARWPQID